MKKPYLIGITGGSGSGKTSFIQKVIQAFGTDELCVISQDDYYRPKKEQKVDKKGISNFDLPGAIYKKEFQADIKKLLAGETVVRQEYTFNNKKVKPKMLTFHPRKIVIVEGLFIFHYKKIRKLLDLKVFVHAKENLKVIRRIQRDGVERNYPLDDVLYRYQHHVLPNFEKYIRPYMDESDLIINNNEDFDLGLEVFIGFLRYKMDLLNKSSKQSKKK